MPSTGHSLAMLGKGSSLTRVVLDSALSEISQAVKQSAEKADTGFASDHDSDSDYACEAPDSSQEPSTACRGPLVHFEISSDLLSADVAVDFNSNTPFTACRGPLVNFEISSDLPPEDVAVDFNSNTPSTACREPLVNFEISSDLPPVDSAVDFNSNTLFTAAPGTVKWFKKKKNPKKIIHVFGLPKGQYNSDDLHIGFGKFGRIIDMLILYREDEAFIELHSTAAAVTVVKISKCCPVQIKSAPVEIRPAEEIYRSLKQSQSFQLAGVREIKGSTPGKPVLFLEPEQKIQRLEVIVGRGRNDIGRSGMQFHFT